MVRPSNLLWRDRNARQAHSSALPHRNSAFSLASLSPRVRKTFTKLHFCPSQLVPQQEAEGNGEKKSGQWFSTAHAWFTTCEVKKMLNSRAGSGASSTAGKPGAQPCWPRPCCQAHRAWTSLGSADTATYRLSYNSCLSTFRKPLWEGPKYIVNKFKVASVWLIALHV